LVYKSGLTYNNLGVLYWGNIPCMLRLPSVLMWVIGMKNVNLVKI